MGHPDRQPVRCLERVRAIPFCYPKHVWPRGWIGAEVSAAASAPDLEPPIVISPPTDGAALFEMECMVCHSEGRSGADLRSVSMEVEEIVSAIVKSGASLLGEEGRVEQAHRDRHDRETRMECDAVRLEARPIACALLRSFLLAALCDTIR